MFLLKGLCFRYKFSCTNGVFLVRNYKGKVRSLCLLRLFPMLCLYHQVFDTWVTQNLVLKELNFAFKHLTSYNC